MTVDVLEEAICGANSAPEYFFRPEDLIHGAGGNFDIHIESVPGTQQCPLIPNTVTPSPSPVLFYPA